MKVFDNIKLGCERIGAIVSTQVKYNAPKIEMGVGMALILFGGYKLYKAGKKSSENNNRKNYEERCKNIDSSFAPKSLKNKEKRKAALDYALSEASYIAPGALSTAGGLFFMKNAFDRVSLAKRALEGALAASVASTNKIMETIKKDGENDNLINEINGARKEEIEISTLNENGGYDTTIKNNLVFNVDDIWDLPGEAFIYSNETCAGMSFQDNDDYFSSLLSDVKAAAERRLLHTHGYCFDEDLVALFGVEPKPLHKTCGYVMPDPKHPLPGDEKRKGVFNFETKKIFIEYPDGSRTRGWLINPINDGVIIDIYQNYSLQRLLVKNRTQRKIEKVMK